MRKKQGVFFAIVISILTLISFYFDKEIVKFFEYIRNPLVTDFFMGMTFISSEIIIFFFLPSLFLWQEHKRKWILPLWFSLFLSVIVSFFLKILVQRQRPFQLNIVSLMQEFESLSFSAWNFSFPSFQTMFAFCAVSILSKNFPRFKYIWILFAALVGISRVYFGLHFISDVILGGVIGYVIGMIIVKTEKENKFWERTYGRVFGK